MGAKRFPLHREQGAEMSEEEVNLDCLSFNNTSNPLELCSKIAKVHEM